MHLNGLIPRKETQYGEDRYSYYGTNPDGSCGFHCSGLNTKELTGKPHSKRDEVKDVFLIAQDNKYNTKMRDFILKHGQWLRSRLIRKDSRSELWGLEEPEIELAKPFATEVDTWDTLMKVEDLPVKEIFRHSPYSNNGWFAYNGLKEQITSYLLNFKMHSFYFDRSLALVCQTPGWNEEHEDIKGRTNTFLVTNHGEAHDSRLVEPHNLIEHIIALRHEKKYFETPTSESWRKRYNRYVRAWMTPYVKLGYKG